MFKTFVIRPCIIKKFGLFMFSWTEQKRSETFLFKTVLPLIKYLFLPPTTTCLVTDISLHFSYPIGHWSASELSKNIVTVALVTPAWPPLNTSSCRDVARTYNQLSLCRVRTENFTQLHTCPKLVMPKTKHIASNTLDFPVPFKPVIAVNSGSNPLISVRLPYDLKPSRITDLMNIFTLVKPYKKKRKFSNTLLHRDWQKIKKLP